MATKGDKLDILHKIFNWAEEKLTTQEVNKLLSATDDKRRTVFHVVTEDDKLKIVQEILKWAKEKLTRLELNKCYWPQIIKE